MGLTRSLLYAGVRNIIVSLWPVNDYSTNDLMMDFYKNILSSKGDKSYSRSLRQAKLKMISGKKYSSPFYWSPFILIGE
jgi:CHAT domain-containing protein